MWRQGWHSLPVSPHILRCSDFALRARESVSGVRRKGAHGTLPPENGTGCRTEKMRVGLRCMRSPNHVCPGLRAFLSPLAPRYLPAFLTMEVISLAGRSQKCGVISEQAMCSGGGWFVAGPPFLPEHRKNWLVIQSASQSRWCLSGQLGTMPAAVGRSATVKLQTGVLPLKQSSL